MSDDGFNMSLRKFLKRAGVTSQQKIEEAVRDARASGALEGRKTIRAKIVLTLDGLDTHHVVEDDIVLTEESWERQ